MNSRSVTRLINEWKQARDIEVYELFRDYSPFISNCNLDSSHLAQGLNLLQQHYPQAEFKTQPPIISNNQAALQWELHCRSTNPVNDVTPHPSNVIIKGADFIRVNKGHVKDAQVFFDLSDIQPLSTLVDGAAKNTYSKSGLTVHDIENIASAALAEIKANKHYLNNEFSLHGLADILGISPKHLSQAINQYFNKTFYNLLNDFRIEAAIELIQQQNHHSMLDIAFECGFNSKSVFYSHFKQRSGQTPMQFRKRLN